MAAYQLFSISDFKRISSCIQGWARGNSVRDTVSGVIMKPLLFGPHVLGNFEGESLLEKCQ